RSLASDVAGAGFEPATSWLTRLLASKATYTIPNLLRGQDSNLRPPGYEPDELPDCSTPRYMF
ncbi:MAG: hypothetical protein ACD_7C00082G0001, partial [uncultured bacterium]